MQHPNKLKQVSPLVPLMRRYKFVLAFENSVLHPKPMTPKPETRIRKA